MKYVRIISDMNLELIEEAFSLQNNDDYDLLFLPFERPSTLISLDEKNTKQVNDFVFTFFMPSMWHLFSHTLTQISSFSGVEKLDEIMGSYIEELHEALPLSDTNFIVLPRIPDNPLFGLSLGGAEYKSFLSWKRIWLNFTQKLCTNFEDHSNVVLVDSPELFGAPENENIKARQRMFFELMVEQTWPEAVAFAQNVVRAVRDNTSVSDVKCICLDLDNTLWGGIIGDLGVSGITLGGLSAKGRAFVEIQKFFKGLKNRGYYLAIVSKNYIDVVLDAIDNHPDMVLRRDDFQVIYCGWGAKSDRIKSVAKALNIGEDALVFFDDSPFERNEVKKNAPQVIVPDYNAKPMECLSRLYSLKLFQTRMVSTDDFLRNSGTDIRSNQIEGANFGETQEPSTSNDNVAANGVFIKFEKISNANFPRVLQLINKTNQFNLTGNRFTERSLNTLLDKCEISLVGKVEDRFANYGLTTILMAKIKGSTIEVQEFAMSCRIFSRGIEIAAVEELVRSGSAHVQKIEEVKFKANKTGKNRALLEFLECIGKGGGNLFEHLGMMFSIELRDENEL